MIIEINKDIDRYQESIALGLNVKQMVFSIASLVVGAGLILLLYQYIGLTASAYVAIPVVAPIAMGGFYSYHGMSFYEVMARKFRFSFGNRALVYESTESEKVIQTWEQESVTKKSKKGIRAKSGTKEFANGSEEKDSLESFEQMQRKTMKMAVGCGIGILAAVFLTILLKMVG